MTGLYERLREINQARFDSIPPRRAGDLPPLSFAQEGLWFEEQLSPGTATYNMPTAIRIRGPLVVDALAAAFRDLQARHEILRTRFDAPHGRPHQVVETATIDMPVVDVEDGGDALALARDEAAAPFRLDRAPLWRISLLRLSGADHILLLTMHHAVSDGWSMAVLFRELAALYGARVSGRDPDLPPLPIQYADYALWQRRWLSGEVLDRQLGYWRRQLRDVPPVLVSGDRLRPPVQSHRGGRVSLRIPRAEMAALERLCADEDATLFMGALALFQLLLHRHTGLDDVAVGVPVANRVRADTHPLIGLFANTIVLRADLSGNPSFRQLLAGVRAAALDGYAHQDLPFERVVEAVQPRRTLAHSPLFQVMFIFQNAPYHAGSLPGLETERVWHLPPASKFDLTLALWRHADRDYCADLEYSADLFDEETMVGMLDQFATLVAAACAGPDRAIGELGDPQPDAITARRGWRHRDELLILPGGYQVSRQRLEGWLAALSSTGEVAAQVLHGQLVAFAVDPPDDWRARLLAELPDFLVPDRVVAIDRMPRIEDRSDALRRLAEEGVPPVRSAVVASTFTAASIEEPLEFWTSLLELPFTVEMSAQPPHAELLDPRGAFARNQGGANILLVRLEDLAPDPEGVAAGVRDLVDAVRTAAATSSATYLIVVCPASPACNIGEEERASLEREISALDGNVHARTSAAVREAYPVDEWNDPEASRLAGMPFTSHAAVAIAAVVARFLHALIAAPKKVLVLDCDQTLWRGVCGEEGPDRVTPEEGHLALQRFALARREAGVLICLCSRNEEADVWQVLARPEMLLRREHVAGARINWRRKVDNLRSLAEELGLGLDSFVFVDDDPWECAQVEAELPEVLTLPMPSVGARVAGTLAQLWAFDRLRTTDEDRRRAAMVADESARQELRGRAPSLADFIDRLRIQITIAPLEPADLARASELTQRTNQFHCAVRRRTEAELAASQRTGELEWLAARVQDRFGDYGLVGLIAWRTSAEALEVDTLLLSCRALGRGVEHRMLAHLGRLAIELGLSRVDIGFRPAPRNAPAGQFLDQLGVEVRTDTDGFTYRVPAATAASSALIRSEA